MTPWKWKPVLALVLLLATHARAQGPAAPPEAGDKAQAQSDPAYRTPETFTGRYGPRWGYRWAKVLWVKVDGSVAT